MNVWMVNPFDPLPGDPEQEGRYATLARILAGRGHRVTWWTSSFSHRFKRSVDEDTIRTACEASGISPRFLKTPPYRRNVGLARLWNHRILTRRFQAEAAGAEPSPDIILASSPPPDLALAAAEIGRARDARTVIDVQDLWPDNFRRLAPPPLRPVADLLLWRGFQVAGRAYAACDAIVGVADAYAQRATELAGQPKPMLTIPLGIDLAAFDEASRCVSAGPWVKAPGQMWMAYTGSLTRNYDFLTIIRAAGRIHKIHGEGVRFFLTGRGDLAHQAEQMVREQGLTNVTLTGFLEFGTWASLLKQCDAAFNASFPEALIYLPNKFFYYLAAGVAVLNTIPGQCSRIVREGGCGLDYQAGDVGSCVEGIERMLNRPQERAAMGTAARRLAETTYDRRVLYPRFAEFIERTAGDQL